MRLSARPRRILGRIPDTPKPRGDDSEGALARSPEAPSSTTSSASAASRSTRLIPSFLRTLVLAPLALVGLLCIAAPDPGPAQPQTVERPTLRSARDVHRLSHAEATLRYPVEFDAVVTYAERDWWLLFVQDDTDGIFVTPQTDEIPVRPGQRVRIRGVTTPGNFAPSVIQATFEDLGEGSLPVPVLARLPELLSGHLDCHWVSVSGYVRARTEEAGHSILRIQTSEGQISAYLAPTVPPAEADRRVDAHVTVSGAAATELNRAGQLVGVRLYVPSLDQVRVDRPPMSDPFSLPVSPISGVLRYQADPEPGRRVLVEGSVTAVLFDGGICIQDASAGMILRDPRTRLTLRVGDHVRVSGFPAPAGTSPTLQDAHVIQAGTAPLPEPVAADADAILDGEHASELVTIKARLVENATSRPGGILVAQSGSTLFEATMPVAPGPLGPISWRAGSELELTGVCVVSRGSSATPNSFRLALRGPADVRVLAEPPWWTLGRLASVLAVVAFLALGALGWSLSLTRKNHELRAANLAAQAACQAKSRFFTIMSHEVRTPLNGVLGMLYLLERDSLTPKQTNHVQIARTSANSLLKLLNDILDFANLDTGNLSLVSQPTPLHALIGKSTQPFSAKARDKGLLWQTEIDPCTPAWVMVDSNRLNQILGALLDNAVKFTPAGQILLRVKSIPSAADTQKAVRVRFEITDTGPGIEPGHLDRLFQPFSQKDTSTTRVHGGTGLGLALAKRLVERMEGRIGVTSQPGAGSTFWVELPLPVVSDSAASPPPPPAANPSPA